LREAKKILPALKSAETEFHKEIKKMHKAGGYYFQSSLESVEQNSNANRKNTPGKHS
jgi:hypothetical protein